MNFYSDESDAGLDPAEGRLQFLESFSGDVLPGTRSIIGFPLDRTCTYRNGTGQGPQAIRRASDSIESYSPFLDRDLLDAPFCDLGDVAFPPGPVEESLNVIRKSVFGLLKRECRPISLGGEHTITLPIISAMCSFYPDLVVIHADAHSDLREEYEGSPISHATVIRRVVEIVGPERVIQLGIRAGTREEFTWMRYAGTLFDWGPAAAGPLLERIRDRPVYLTFDVDVLDPSCLPGTGNPEPGGWNYRDVERLLSLMDKVNMVGADVVELNPGLDPSEVSSVTAAMVVRELLLL